MADEVAQDAVATEAPAEAAAPAAAPAESAAPAAAPAKPASRRAGLDAIYDRKAAEPAEQGDRTPIEKQRDAASGRFKKPDEAAAPEAKPPAQAAAVPKRPSTRAPSSWGASAKLWDSLSDEAKAFVAKREQQIGGLAQKYEQTWAPFRKHAEDFAKTVAPYEAIMRQEAATRGEQYNPLRTVSGLLQTAASLRHYDKRVGAGVVAQILQTYGIGPDLVADALEGKGLKPGEQPGRDPRPPPAPQLDPEKVYAEAESRIMKRFQAAQEQRDGQEAETSVQSFAASHEHFEAVRERMADLVEMNARRMASLPPGERVALSLDEAYRVVCLSDPALAPSIQQAAAAAEPEKPKGPTPPAQRAASSIRSRPGGTARPAEPAPKTRLDGLRRIWEQKFEQR